MATPRVAAPEARVIGPDTFPELIQAITPSRWLLDKVEAQYDANTARLLRQLNGSFPAPELGVEIMFESPIYRLNLRDLGVEPGILTKSVARVILREYHRRAVMGKDAVMSSLEESEKAKERAERAAAARDAVLRGEAPSAAAIAGPGRSADGRLADGGSEEDGDTSVFNDAFFTWQSEKNGWELMFGKHEQLERVKAFWARAADHFLRSMGHAAVFEGHPRHRQPEMHSWATVHKDCVFHGMHHHGEDIMSGVFYVKVPPGAGSISFFDPRGFHAPFLNRITVQPSEGDIVLFPSSLVHQVTPTQGDSERISIAVNLLGRHNHARGSEAMPSGLVNPSDPVAVPDVLPDWLYALD